MNAAMSIDSALALVAKEIERTQSIYGAFASAHEGYAVILEEMDELRAEVWKGPKSRDYGAMLIEAKQVAAMAARLMIEIAAPKVVDEYRHIDKLRIDTNGHAEGGIKSHILSALQYYGPMTVRDLEVKLNKPGNVLTPYLTSLYRAGKVEREYIRLDDTRHRYYRYTAYGATNELVTCGVAPPSRG